MPTLPAALAGPVELTLARAQENIPAPDALPGGCRYELKWDGYRACVVRDEAGARVWSRRGKDLSATFPDLVAAALEQLAPGTVLDGEAVIWSGAHLDFDLLQQRMVAGPGRTRSLAARHPANLAVFDLLALDGRDLRRRTFDQRREQLQELAAAWSPPLQLSPLTEDVEEAGEWFRTYRAAGIEGLVVKGGAGRYAPWRRSWVKVKSRESVEVLIGAVTGSLRRPESVVAGLYRDGELAIVGRTTPLTREQAATLSALLVPAGAQHPWPDAVGASHFGAGREKVALVKVQPQVVLEVLADAALHHGGWRHPLRYVRPRLDMTAADLASAPG